MGSARPRPAEWPQSPLRALFERHAPSLQRFFADLLPAADVASAVEESFVRAGRCLIADPHARTLRDTTAWLMRIACEVLQERLPVAASQQKGRPFDDALRCLPSLSRAALLLHADHGLRYAEVAALLGWSLPQAKAEIWGARRQLAAAYGL